jgi:hypothetical protein
VKERQRDRKTERQKDRKTERQRKRKKEKEREREREREKYNCPVLDCYLGLLNCFLLACNEISEF